MKKKKTRDKFKQLDVKSNIRFFPNLLNFNKTCIAWLKVKFDY